MLDAGIHFGHRTSRWNPKMQPYIFGKRNTIHVIDIKETLRGLLRAKAFISRVVAEGKDVLFVGTKRQARAIVMAEATRSGMHYVADRWLGGALTNFRTIRSRLARLEELEALEADGKLQQYSKKMISTLTREKRKIKRNLEGIRRMNRLPGALVIVDVRREHIAVKEAKKLNIPTVCLIDTDSDPDFADIPIPGNDDAIRAIELVMHELADAIEEGKRARGAVQDEGGEAGGSKQPRRSRRATTARAEESPAPPQTDESAAPAAAASSPAPESAAKDQEPAGAPAPPEATPNVPAPSPEPAGT